MTAGAQTRRINYPLLLTTVSLGGVLAPLNSTMLTVALPELRHDFTVGHSAIGWLVSSYLIAMAVAQPLGGRLGDQLGRARVFRLGLIAFLVLSLGASLAPTFEVLVLLRTGQALVGATVIPNGMAMLRATLPARQLGRSAGITGAAISLSAAVGPLLGGALLSAGSWRYLFLMNVPLVLVALAAQARLRYPEPATRERLDLDWLGAVSFGALLAFVTLALNSLGGSGGTVAMAVGGTGVIVLGAVFLQSQRRSPRPVVEWRLFQNRSFLAATSFVLLSNLVMYTTLLSVPFFVEEVQGKGHGTTALLLGSMSALVAFVAPVGGRFSDAYGRRAPAIAGSVVALAAMIALLAGLSRDVSGWYLAGALSALGLGLGLSVGPSNTAAIESASREQAGTAAGTNSMMRYVGSIVGAGILGAVLSSEATPEVSLFRLIFVVLVAMAAVACVTTLFIHRFPSSYEEPEPLLGAELPAVSPAAPGS